MTWWILFFVVIVVLVFLIPDVFIGGLKFDSKRPDTRNHYYNVIIWPNDIPTQQTGLSLPNGVKYMQSHLSMHGIDAGNVMIHLKNQMYNQRNAPMDNATTMSYNSNSKDWTTKGTSPQPIDYYAFLVLLKALSSGVNGFSVASTTLSNRGMNAKEIWSAGQTLCFRRLGSSISGAADAYATKLLKPTPSESVNVWNTPAPMRESLFSRFSS